MQREEGTVRRLRAFTGYCGMQRGENGPVAPGIYRIWKWICNTKKISMERQLRMGRGGGGGGVASKQFIS